MANLARQGEITAMMISGPLIPSTIKTERRRNVAKLLSNHGKPWTPAVVQQLKQLAKGNTPTGLIAHQFGRTKGAIRSKSSENGVPLKPTNQSPFSRRKP
jgi:hypothetical protein